MPEAGGPRRRRRTPPTKKSLPPACARLVTLFQEVNFGRIEGLKVEDGLPVLDPLPTVTQTIRMGGRNGARPETRWQDYVLKKEVVEFFQHLRRLGNGVIDSIEVQNGLPRAMKVTRRRRG